MLPDESTLNLSFTLKEPPFILPFLSISNVLVTLRIVEPVIVEPAVIFPCIIASSASNTPCSFTVNLPLPLTSFSKSGILPLISPLTCTLLAFNIPSAVRLNCGSSVSSDFIVEDIIVPVNLPLLAVILPSRSTLKPPLIVV